MSRRGLLSLPVPRLSVSDPVGLSLARRCAQLVCVNASFDNLARQVGLAGAQDGVTDSSERTRLCREIDALVAHLYGLDESELAQILRSFRLVPEPTRVATLNAWRDVKYGLIF